MSKDSSHSLDFWREAIDELDRELVRLLARRTQYAIEIGRIKARRRLQVYDPEREEEVMANVETSAGGYLTPGSARRIFERIVDETRRTEREHRKTLAAAPSSGEGGES